MSALTTSSSCVNWRRGSNPNSSGAAGIRNACANGVAMWSPSTFENRSTVTSTCGLSSAKSRTNDSHSSSVRSIPVCGTARAGRLLPEEVRVLVVRPVHEGGALHHDLAHRAVGGARRRQQVHGPDHVDLVHRPAAELRRVDGEVGVQDRVDLRGLDDALEDRVRRVGPHELGAFERQHRFGRVDADDDLDVGASFELLGQAAAPERAQARDEYPHGASPTRRCGGPAACRTARAGSARGCARPRP